MSNKNIIQIKSFSGKIKFEYRSDENTIKKTLEEAARQGADLRGVDLRDADLRGADIENAYLQHACLRGSDLREANLREVDLRDADLRHTRLRDVYFLGTLLRGADLRGAKNIPQSYINLCSRDMLFIFGCLKAELPFLREKLVSGEVNGTTLDGDCACLIGTLSKAVGDLEKVSSKIPFYEIGLDNHAEQWFSQIREGDTPENSFFAKHALELIDSVLKPSN